MFPTILSLTAPLYVDRLLGKLLVLLRERIFLVPHSYEYIARFRLIWKLVFGRIVLIEAFIGTYDERFSTKITHEPYEPFWYRKGYYNISAYSDVKNLCESDPSGFFTWFLFTKSNQFIVSGKRILWMSGRYVLIIIQPIYAPLQGTGFLSR